MPNRPMIQPLFYLPEKSDDMGKLIIQLPSDNYNKGAQATLIDAENDAEAIQSFLNEYKESPETLRSYSKEIERLLLWCIHVNQTNITSLKRDHLLAYQTFLKNPTPKKLWCGPSAARQLKDGSPNK